MRGFRAKPPAFAQLGVARANIGVMRPAAVASVALPCCCCLCCFVSVSAY
jgi:hypothetical protein